MKCGICGKDTLPNGAPIGDAHVLNLHKAREHPQGFKATIEKRRATKEANRIREAREARIDFAVQAAAAQATGMVLRKWGKIAPERQNSIEGFNPARNLDAYRVAQPEIYASYLALTIAAAARLEQAYQQGRPITEEDVERVRLAVAEARQKAEKEGP